MQKILLIALITSLYAKSDSTNVIPEDKYKFTVKTSTGIAFKITDYNIINDKIQITGDGINWKLYPLAQIKNIADNNNNIIWENNDLLERLKQKKVIDKKQEIIDEKQKELKNKTYTFQLGNIMLIGNSFLYTKINTSSYYVSISKDFKLWKKLFIEIRLGGSNLYSISNQEFKIAPSASWKWQSNYNDNGFIINGGSSHLADWEYILVHLAITYQFRFYNATYLNIGLIYLHYFPFDKKEYNFIDFLNIFGGYNFGPTISLNTFF